METAADSQIERSIVEPFSGISSNSRRPVIVVRIVVQVGPGLDVKWVGRSVSEDIAQLKTVDRPSPPLVAAPAWRFDCAADRQAVPLVVVRKTPLTTQEVIILWRGKEEIARIVDRFRVCVRDPGPHPALEAPVERKCQSVVIGIPGTFEAADIAKTRIGTPEIGYPGRSRESRDINIAREDQVQSTQIDVAGRNRGRRREFSFNL